MATVGSRSKRNLDSVDPTLRDIVTEALEQAPPWLDFAVTSGTRSTAQQRGLFMKGRNDDGEVIKPEAVVTNADGIIKKSNHQAKVDGGKGTALDIVAYLDGNVTWDATEVAERAGYIIGYAAAKGIRLTGGLKWNWDRGHLQLV